MARTGRPMKFKSVEAIQPLIDKYFEDTPDERLTITGLALALDTSRETLMDYEGRDEFSDTIKKAKNRIQESYEVSLRKRGNAGDIFALKNFGWKDKQETDINLKGNLSMGSAFEAIKDKDKTKD